MPNSCHARIDHPVDLAVAARDEKFEGVVGQLVDFTLDGRGLLPIRLAVGFDHRVVPQPYAPGRRNEPAAAIAEAVDVFRDLHGRVDQQILVAPNRGPA